MCCVMCVPKKIVVVTSHHTSDGPNWSLAKLLVISTSSENKSILLGPKSHTLFEFTIHNAVKNFIPSDSSLEDIPPITLTISRSNMETKN